MTIQELLSDYGNIAYGLMIFFGGRVGLQYFTLFRKTKHNFLLFATVFAALWIIAEVAAGTFKIVDLGRYLLTFAVVTTCYHYLVEWFPFLKPKKDE
jgi:hypothetical protein